MIKKNFFSSGFSLIEVIVAVALFGLFATALIGLLLVAHGSSAQSKEKDQAILYAQEGIDAIISIRRQGWNMLPVGSHGLTAENGYWELKSQPDLLDNFFNRTVFISEVCRDNNNDFVDCIEPQAAIDPYVKKIIVQVQYQAINGISNQMNLETYLTNWQSVEWHQNNWTSGPGQSLWSNLSAFAVSDGNIDYSSLNGLALKEQSGVKIKQWSISAAQQYLFDNSLMQIVDGAIRLIPVEGQQQSQESDNSEFNNINGWTFHQWDVDPTDPSPVGELISSGGNPGGYFRITLPRSRNSQFGGWLQRAVNIDAENIESVYLDFDGAILQKNIFDPAFFKIYVFIDQAGGLAPVMGSQVWESDQLANVGTIGWTRIENINAGSAVPSTGTFFLKLAVWLESQSILRNGQIRVGFDNAKVNWSWSGQGYPTSGPSIQPAVAFEAIGVGQWLSFSEQAIKNGGEIFYQLSADNGNSWLYWNGNAWVIAGENQYNTAIQINNFIQFFPTASESLLFKAFLVSDGSQAVSLSKVTVSYATSEGEYWGNQFVVDDVSSSEPINNSAARLSLRFTARSSKTVNQIRLYQVTASGGSFRVGIQADDGNGNPDGVYLGSRVDSSSSSNSWRSFNVTPAVNLIAGQVYHIVVQPEGTGAINRSYRVFLPHHNFITSSLLPDSKLNVLRSVNSGNTWTEQNQSPVFVLRYSDNTYDGTSYHTVMYNNANWSLVYGNLWRAQTFIYQGGEPLSVYGAAVYVRKSSNQQPADDLYLIIYDHTNDTPVASTTAIYAFDVSENFQWKTVNFPQDIELISGNTYSIMMASPQSNSQAAYDFLLLQNTNNEVYNSVNFQATGGMFLRSNNAGGSWASASYLDMPFRLIHYGQGGGYAPFGWVESSAFSTGSASSFNALSFEVEKPLCSPTCEVRLQIRTATDNNGSPGAWTDWFGPTGAGTYFINPGINILPTELNFKHWVQYRVELSGDGNNTPILKKVLINYAP